MAKRKTYSASFKSRVALDALKGDQTMAELAAKYQVHPAMVTKWKKQAMDSLVDVFSGNGCKAGDASHGAEVKELHAKIGQLTVEKDFLAKAFSR